MSTAVGRALGIGALTLLTACAESMPMAAAKEAPAKPAEVSAGAMREPSPKQDRDHDGIRDEEYRESTGFLAQNGPGAQSPAPAPPPPPSSPAAAGKPSAPPNGQSASEISATRAPMLIYSAQITMAVFEVNKGLAEVEDLGRELGGFLAKRDDQAITIRVPVARFPDAVKRIEKIGDMIHRNVTAEDVTEEFRDVEVRLKNSRAVRDRLEQLLQKAVKVEESVVIERELARVTQEIEQMEGRIKFLKDRAAFSTITVSFEAHKQENVSSSFHLPVPWLGDLGLGRLLNL